MPEVSSSRRLRLVLTVAAVVWPTVTAANQAIAAPVTKIDRCPYVIAAPGHYLVVQDLVCPDGTAVTIMDSASGAHLNLGGHTINGNGNTTGEGIDVLGASRLHINNGTVTGFLLDDGLRLHSDGSRLSALTLTGNHDGLGISSGTNNAVSASSFSDNQRFGAELSDSSSNRFVGTTAADNGSDGFAFFSSSDNDIRASRASGNENGVAIRGGSGNLVQSTRTSHNDHEGIAIVAADHNLVKANSSRGNGFHGILVVDGALNNTIESNASLNNGTFDMGDENPNCDSNVWRHNHFETANQPDCIE